MLCFGKKPTSKKGGQNAPLPVVRSGDLKLERKGNNQGARSMKDGNVKTVPIDLRAEKDEPPTQQNRLMEYLSTQVVTKNDDKRWVQRLFVLTDDAISCYYESAPHL